MLGCKPIVRNERLHPGVRGDVTDEMSEGLGGPEVEPPRVQMQNRIVGRRCDWANPETRDTSDRLRFEGHVVARQNALHEGIERRTRFDPPQPALRRARRRSHGVHDRGIVWVEWMYHCVLLSARGRSRGSKVKAVSLKTFLRSASPSAWVCASRFRLATARSRRNDG